MEDDGRGVDDGDVDRGQAALVGEDEGDAEQVTDESGDAAADPEDEVAGVVADEIGRSSGDGESVVEHGAEELRIGLGDHRGVPDDALREGSVLLQALSNGMCEPIHAWRSDR